MINLKQNKQVIKCIKNIAEINHYCNYMQKPININ